MRSPSRAPASTGGDLIDLAGIDANATAGGNQAFVFGGTGIGRVSVGDVRHRHA